MTEPLRSPEPDEPGTPAPSHADEGGSAGARPDMVRRAREQAEAQAAVIEVMRREQVKYDAAVARTVPSHKRPLMLYLLVSLLAFNVYAWAGNPGWLRFHEPQLPAPSYYASSWKMAVYLQRERIEEYRQMRGRLPASATQAGPPVRGVQYRPLPSSAYELAAGEGLRRFVYFSTDSAKILVGQAFVQMSLLTGGVR